MGGCSLEDDFEYISPDLTLLLIGKTGNGKTSTGNSIMGMEVFESKPSSFGVNSSVLRKTILTDGQMLNVIDTHGLFDSSVGSDERIEKEIVSCMNMGTNIGVHAVLVVFSVCCGFSKEEEAVISRLLSLFGRRIYDYMIIVFTGGDELESHGRTLDDFLYDCPETLKKILCFCGNRCVLFDNMTKNQTKKGDQVNKLLFLVNMVLEKNGGRPCKEMYTEFKSQAEKFQSLKVTKKYTEEELSLLLEKMFEEQFEQKTEMFESRLEQLLGKERDARLKTEEAARTEQMRSNEEIEKMRDSLDMLQLNLLIVFILFVMFLFSGKFGFEVIRYFL